MAAQDRIRLTGLLRKSPASAGLFYEELRARARELREEAAHTDIDGFRNAALAMAERYELAAAERVPAR